MRHLAVAIVAVALIAASFGADLWLTADQAHEWGLWAGVAVILAGLEFMAGDK